MKIKLTKCELCCFSHETYHFFEKDSADYYIVEYEFRLGSDKPNKIYSLMRKGHYRNKGIALVIGDQMIYALGEKCFITGYCPIEIEKENI